jgi:hydroxymethylglutaryl-CoA synthase
MNVGIDLIHFATADYYLGLDTFAQEKGIDVNKFYVGIGQERMSIAPPDEDIVTLSAKAAEPLLNQIDRDKITAVLLATESGVDQSKSASAYLHGLLGLHKNCRLIELKHACYAGAAALQMAQGLVHANPNEKVLVIAADIAKYDVDSSGEATQGCGAAAMIIKKDPRLLVLEPGSGFYSDDVMDFWRPNYRETALVDGKYSTKVYLNSLKETWQHFVANTGRAYDEIDYFCYHLPFTKMAEKAHKQLTKVAGVKLSDEQMQQLLAPMQAYNRQLGNSYTASLFIGFSSLLDNVQEDLTGKRIGLFSYGSGCVSEFFTGIIQPGYQNYLFTEDHLWQIEKREPLSYSDYLQLYHTQPEGLYEGQVVLPEYNKGPFRLKAIKDHKRIYERKV